MHSIGRFEIKVNCTNASQAFAIKEEIADIFEKFMEQELEKILDPLSNNTDTILIPKIEIHLGKIQPNQLPGILETDFGMLLKEKITEALYHHEHRKDHYHPMEAAPPIEIKPQPVRDFEILLHYLVNGMLPWPINANEFEIIYNRLFDQPDDTFAHEIYPYLSNKNVLKRISLLLKTEQGLKLFKFLCQEIKSSLFISGQRLIETIGSAAFIHDIRQAYSLTENSMIENILKIPDEISALSASGKTVSFTIREVVADLNEKESRQRSVLMHLFIQPYLAIILQDVSKFNEIWFKHTQYKITDHPVMDDPKDRTTANLFIQQDDPGENPKIDLTLPVNHHLTRDVNIEDKKEGKSNPTREIDFLSHDSLVVYNAGIILLHPFFSALFKNLDLLNEEGLFKNEKCREKAMLILDYLVNGADRSEEYELVIYKILCGWPVDQFVSIKPKKLNRSESQECDALLSHVIAHWAALKSTSIQGLRESFLKRKGVLKKAESGWNLKIPYQTYDILLDRLPWSYSVIKLKWTNDHLYTAW